MPETPSIRRSSRLMIVSSSGRLLLFRYDDEHSGEFWATVGGELQGQEDYRAAAQRELFEETGYCAEIGRWLTDRESVYAVAGSSPARWMEKYFLVNVDSEDVPCDTEWTEEEKSTITSHRWWTCDELTREPMELKPDWIPELLTEILANHHPSKSEPR